MQNLQTFWNFWNVQKCFAVIIDNPYDPQISSILLYLGFWVLNLNLKIDFFLKWPPFDFDLISAKN